MTDDLRDKITEAVRPWFNYYVPGGDGDPQPTHSERIAGAADAALAVVGPELERLRTERTGLVEATALAVRWTAQARAERDALKAAATVNGALHRSAERDVTAVHALIARWEQGIASLYAANEDEAVAASRTVRIIKADAYDYCIRELRAALAIPTPTEGAGPPDPPVPGEIHVDRHGRSWDPHPFVQSRAVENANACICGQSSSHFIHAAPTPTEET